MLFAYLAPDVMWPVASIIAAGAGVVMMFGRNVMGYCRRMVRRSLARVSTEAGVQRYAERGNRSLANTRGIADGESGCSVRDLTQAPEFPDNERGWSHQKSHRHRPGWSGPPDRVGAARGRPTAQPGSVERAGGIRPRRDDAPAQTPVAWSTFATGTNPGGHGIFDFLRRNPKNYLPDLALNRYEQKNAFLPPKAVNLRRGTPIWELLKAAGRGATVLRCPCTYPPDPIRGRMLSGMGVPDLRGGLGTATFYTTDAPARPRESENVVSPSGRATDAFSTHLIGPRNPKTRRRPARRGHDSRRSAGRGGSSLRSDGTPRELEVRQGAWSDWLRVKFKLGLLQSIRGMVRFHLVGLRAGAGALRLADQLRSRRALLSRSASPSEYAGDLAREIGLFYTTGMVEDHTGLNNERISEEAFLDQCAIAWREREAMMLHELESVRRRAVLLSCSTRPTGSSTCSGGTASPTTRPTAACRPTLPSPASSTTPTAAATRSSARHSSTPTTRRS